MSEHASLHSVSIMRATRNGFTDFKEIEAALVWKLKRMDEVSERRSRCKLACSEVIIDRIDAY